MPDTAWDILCRLLFFPQSSQWSYEVCLMLSDLPTKTEAKSYTQQHTTSKRQSPNSHLGQSEIRIWVWVHNDPVWWDIVLSWSFSQIFAYHFNLTIAYFVRVVLLVLS